MPITKQQLANIISPVKYADDKLQAIADALNETFSKYEINTNLRMCHFLGQVLYESSAFRYSVEIWGNTEAQKRYDTRTDLGNTPELDGDGYKYRGRGWIQLTGKTNYRLASDEFHQDFVSNPDLLAKEPWDGLAAGWFWSKRKLNTFADADDIITITKRINGGFNGLNERKMWLTKAKGVLNA
ncbi:MAG: glycoside hydrolase family 19 protein [Parafilimonas sp.]|nr:glycoside hydrolase family 19 protein [Parafilimonas sp.]